MSTLWVTGDSYSHINPDEINDKMWSIELSEKLKFRCYNMSMWGISQDWEFKKVLEFKENVKPDDQIVLVLTHPSRYWFFDEFPYATNIHTYDFEEVVGSEKADAVAKFVKHIQRLDLDTQHLGYRLGWLNNLALIRNWRPPIILLGFSQFIPNLENYPNLVFSIGNLTDNVSNEEISKEFNGTQLSASDPRHNHMCLQNHAILADKLFDTITNSNPLDLTFGFNKNIITDTSFASNDFINQEFSKVNYNKMKEIVPVTGLVNSFYKKIYQKK
jgi:hypothetical protein